MIKTNSPARKRKNVTVAEMLQCDYCDKYFIENEIAHSEPTLAFDDEERHFCRVCWATLKEVYGV